MKINHNMSAVITNHQLLNNENSLSVSMEKLSSGLRINHAKDDAAGMAISTKMRAQIQGLNQASRNASDGNSILQTADGALNEVTSMIQRMRELAVQAANETNTDDDKDSIQDEIESLKKEIDRVSTTTKFNESYLLKGVNQDGTAAKLTYKTASGNITDIDENTGKKEYALGTATKKTVTDKGEYNVSTVEVMGKKYGLVTGIKDADTAGGKTLSEKEALADAKANADATDGAFATQDELIAQIKKDLNEAGAGDIKSISVDKDGKVTVEAFADLNASLNFSLHVGADSTEDNKIDVDIAMMSARGLGVNGIQVSGDDDTKATAAIDTISAAIQKVSTQRSALGAVQNRLEHTINNLDNVVENTTSAESAIRDTDMATEMVKYSNNNILSQAGQAMLAQSNQANQGVLSLLQ